MLKINIEKKIIDIVKFYILSNKSAKRFDRISNLDLPIILNLSIFFTIFGHFQVINYVEMRKNLLKGGSLEPGFKVRQAELINTGNNKKYFQ